MTSGAPWCRICQEGPAGDRLIVPEAMFGAGEQFPYVRCGRCGSLQLETVPTNLARYYPTDYYAHQVSMPAGPPARLRRLVMALRNIALVRGGRRSLSLLGILPVLGPATRVHPLAPLRLVRLGRASRIADVGGGSGYVLGGLRDIGFRELTCIDPFIAEEGRREGIRFVRCRLADVTETFDLVMYHHALEHVPDLDAELAAASARLSGEGRLLVRLPVLPNAAFDRFGRHWIQLDAPRHVHVPSRSGLRRAAARHGLRVLASGDDSTAFQFWGSELAARGVPLTRARDAGFLERTFGSAALRGFARDAAALNRAGRGDQGWLLLAREA